MRWPRSSRVREATAQARAWAASSPLADTQDAVVGDVPGLARRRGRGGGHRPAAPLDDETIERLAGPVRERLALVINP